MIDIIGIGGLVLGSASFLVLCAYGHEIASDRVLRALQWTLLMSVIAVCSTTCAGCGATPQQTARHFVDGAGEALDITDIAVAQAYTDRAREALAAASDLAAYHAAMAPMDDLERGLRVARSALELGDAAIRVWDQNGARDFPQALSCIVGALVGLRSLLTAANVPIPPEITAALDLVHEVVDGDRCFSTDGGV